jgi:hypothetical protein
MAENLGVTLPLLVTVAQFFAYLPGPLARLAGFSGERSDGIPDPLKVGVEFIRLAREIEPPLFTLPPGTQERAQFWPLVKPSAEGANIYP